MEIPDSQTRPRSQQRPRHSRSRARRCRRTVNSRSPAVWIGRCDLEGQRQGTRRLPHTTLVYALAFAPDGRTLLTGGGNPSRPGQIRPAHEEGRGTAARRDPGRLRGARLGGGDGQGTPRGRAHQPDSAGWFSLAKARSLSPPASDNSIRIWGQKKVMSGGRHNHRQTTVMLNRVVRATARRPMEGEVSRMQATTFGSFPAAEVLAAELEALADPAVTRKVSRLLTGFEHRLGPPCGRPRPGIPRSAGAALAG